jgi:2-dehydropantoate 2-reductase
LKIGVFGAGSIGCYAGGMLAADGNEVALVGRDSMGKRLARGIELTRHDGMEKSVPAAKFTFATEPGALAGCEAVLICVKSTATQEAGRELASVLRQNTLVASFQNGVSNTEVLRASLPQCRVLGAMVPFNVAQIGENRFHQGTQGGIVLEDRPGVLKLAAALNQADLPTMVRRDFTAVQWGKLLMNLNNAVNALSGLTLKAQLSRREHRLMLADCVAEGLTVLRAADIRPAKIGKVAPGLIPFILRLPDFLFTRVAASMLKIDDNARSSMAEDLDRGRRPEIDHLNGEIVRLGAKTGVATPVNSRIVEEVRQRFAQQRAEP